MKDFRYKTLSFEDLKFFNNDCDFYLKNKETGATYKLIKMPKNNYSLVRQEDEHFLDNDIELINKELRNNTNV